MDSPVFVVCVSLIWVITALLKTATTSGGWGEGEEEGVLVLRISNDGDDQMGTKRKRKKIPGPKFNPPPHPPPPKKEEKKSHPGIRRNYQESSDCSEYPKEFPPQIKIPKKILAKIFLSKFQTQTILRSFPSYEIWSTPQGRYIHNLSGIRRYMLGKSYDLKEKDAIK